MYTVYCIPYTVYCILYTVYCIPYTAYCILHTAYCTLRTAYCTLHTAHCTQGAMGCTSTCGTSARHACAHVCAHVYGICLWRMSMAHVYAHACTVGLAPGCRRRSLRAGAARRPRRHAEHRDMCIDMCIPIRWPCAAAPSRSSCHGGQTEYRRAYTRALCMPSVMADVEPI